MGILASDQITITDITDGYAVILTSETYTFVENSSGGTKNQSCTTEAVAYCGSNLCSAVNVSEKDIVCPTGITAEVSNSGSSKVKIAFKTSANLTGACEATIPVVVDGIIVNKKFSFAVAKAGADGAPGKPGTDGQDGIDGIAMSVTASHGTIFKTNTGNTVLTAHIFNGGVEQPIDGSGICGDLGTVKWYKAGTSSPISASGSITAVASDITTTVTYTVQLENSDGVKATTQITISKVIDVYAVTRYYMLQSSSSAAPSKPTTNPPAGWSDTEPSYVSGSTNTLYFVDCNVYSDKTFSFSEVSKSSTYEAAKDAWNKANNAQESIDNLEIGGRNLFLASDMNTSPDEIVSNSSTSDWTKAFRIYNGHKSLHTFTAQQGSSAYIDSIALKGTKGNIGICFCRYAKEVLKAGNTYTISFYAKCNDVSIPIWIGLSYYNTSDSFVFRGGENIRYLSKADTWEKIVFTFTLKDLDVKYMLYAMGGVASNITTDVVLQIKEPKLEAGNKATDWTPAPEDLISQVDVEYYLSDSAVSLSGGSWTTLAPEWVDGKFMWSRTVTTNGTGNKSYSPSKNGVCIAGATGNTGATGKGIKSIVEQYYKSTSATLLTGGLWSTIYPGCESGKYIWTRSVTTYTDNTTDMTTPICVTGEKGNAGKDGISPTVSVSKSGNTTTIIITDKDGTHTQTVKDGENGTPGAPGSDGRTPYIHVKYSDDGGKTFTSNLGETVGTYIGICTDYNMSDPTTVGSYVWAKIKGEKGDDFRWNLVKGSSELTIGTGKWSDRTWRKSGTGSISNVTIEDSPVASISNGILIKRSDTNNQIGFCQDSLSLIKGETYTISAWVKCSEKMYVRLQAYWWNGDSTGVGNNVLVEANTWTYLSCTASPANTQIYNVGYIYSVSGSVDATMQVCAVKLELGSPATPWSPHPDDLVGTDGKGIKSTAITYQASTSGTVIPTGTWQTSIPTVSAGQYLWTRTVITYTDDSKSTSYSVGRMGTNGSAGRGIKSTAITYQAGSSGTTAPTGTWQTTVPATSASSPYLWTRTIITYTDDTTSTSYAVGSTLEGVSVGCRNLARKTSNEYNNPPYTNFNGDDNKCPPLAHVYLKGLSVGDKVTVRLVYKYTNIVAVTGKTAAAWLQGNGNITGWTSGAFWSSLHIVLSGSGEKIIKYSFVVTSDMIKNQYWDVNIRHDGIQSGSVQWKEFKVEKGNIATDWTPAPEDGIASVDVEYYLSNSATALSGGSWSTTAPTWVNGKYMWSRTATTDGAGNKTYSPNQNGVCIAGAKGDPGATGKGVSSIVEQYYKSTSATDLSGGSWGTTYPGWESGKYIWTRSVITYTDKTTTTTTAVCVTGTKGNPGVAGKDAIIISSTAPTSPKTGQLWQTASGEPIKRWDGSKWVLHYISVENLDVKKLSAIAADLGTVTAGVIKNKAETVNIDVENGLIETYDDTFNSRSVYESGTSQYFGKDPATNTSVVTIDYNGIRHNNAAMGTTTMLTPKDKDWWIGDDPWADHSNALPIHESLETLLNKDSVVAQGTSGIWFYRKWASGFAECIGTQDFSFNQTSGKVCMLGGVNYPFTFKAIISKIKYVTYTSGSKLMFATSGGKDSWSMTDTGYTSIMADANYIDTQAGKISYIIKGKWK